VANQLLAPNATSNGFYTWGVQPGCSTTNIHTHIDEETASDTDSVRSFCGFNSALPTNESFCTFTLEDTTIVEDTSGHILRIRAKYLSITTPDAGDEVTVRLRDGDSNLIATWALNSVDGQGDYFLTTAWQTFEIALSDPQIALIQNYDGMTVRFDHSSIVFGGPPVWQLNGIANVSWLQMEIAEYSIYTDPPDPAAVCASLSDPAIPTLAWVGLS
jgi:hypothetical protein